jgi:hypothetical protein
VWPCATIQTSFLSLVSSLPTLLVNLISLCIIISLLNDVNQIQYLASNLLVKAFRHGVLPKIVYKFGIVNPQQLTWNNVKQGNGQYSWICLLFWHMQGFEYFIRELSRQHSYVKPWQSHKYVMFQTSQWLHEKASNCGSKNVKWKQKYSFLLSTFTNQNSPIKCHKIQKIE